MNNQLPPSKKMASVEVFPQKTSTEKILEILISFRRRKSDGETTDNQLEVVLDKIEEYLRGTQSVQSEDNGAIVADREEIHELDSESDEEDKENEENDASDIEELWDEIEKMLGVEKSQEEQSLLDRLTVIHEELENVCGAIENIASDLQTTSEPNSPLEKIVEDIADDIEKFSENPRKLLLEVKDVIELTVLTSDDRVLRKKVEALRDGISEHSVFSEVRADGFYNSVAPRIKWS